MPDFVQPPCDHAVIRAHPPGAACAKTAGPWILAATILGSSMAFIDGTVVNVALPALQQSLHATIIDAQWVVEAYALPLAALLLVGGSLGDHYGRRFVFLLGVVIFSMASAGCGLAGDVRQLIAARAGQGAGAALLIPGSLAMISASFQDVERGRAIGTWSGFTAITAAIGPVAGGWLIEHFSWRAAFFLNLPIAAIVLIISLRCLPESRDEKERARLDWIGAALATAGLGSLVYGLIESAQLGFAATVVRSALIIGALLLGSFLVWEARTKNPMLPLGLFRSRDFLGTNILTFLLYSALGGALFFFPLNLIQVQGYSATAAGAALLPFILIMFLLSRWSGGLIIRFGAKLPLTAGPLLAALGYLLFAVPAIHTSYWRGFFPAVTMLGLGMALSVAPLTTTVMNSVAGNRVGVASGVNNAVARAASLLAIAVFGIVMLSVFTGSLRARLLQASPEIRTSLEQQRIKLAAVELPAGLSPAESAHLKEEIDLSFVSGFRAVMLFSAALALASALTSAILIGNGRRAN